jgi:KaiC/GvpD/RAD55 family RecA-like ATPase
MTIPQSPVDDSRLRDGTLATGINTLDTESLQGIPAGSTVAILGNPLGMAEQFLYHLVHTDRMTHYVSTARPTESIRQTLAEVGNVDETALNIENIYSNSKSTQEILKKHTARIKPGHNLIVDTFTNAYDEEDPEKLMQATRNIYSQVNANDALAYLYFANNNIDQFTRAERETLYMCDAVFKITTQRTNNNIDTTLEILRMRGREFPDERISLNIGRRLTVDTTRNIS